MSILATDEQVTTVAKSDADSEFLADDVRQLVSFRLASEEYGVDIMDVQEIILIGHTTEMPGVPSHVRGLVNLRGHVIPIIDLRLKFGLEATASTDESRVIVLNVGNRTVGVVVDAVNQVLRSKISDIEPAPRGALNCDSGFVSGIVNLGGSLLILLNIAELIEMEMSPT